MPRQVVDVVLVFAIVVVTLGTLLIRPDLVYTPISRTVLFFFLALLFAILFSRLIEARLELRGRGYLVVTSGVTAAVLIISWFLAELAAPEEMIAVYEFYDEDNRAVDVTDVSAVHLATSFHGATVTMCKRDNALFLIFPSQVPSVVAQVEDPDAPGSYFRGELSYTGAHGSRVVLGKDFVK